MIVKMLRYDLVLLKQQSEDFIERLRELGLVDITTTGWEPQEKDRLLLVEIDQYQKALDQLEAFAQSEDCVKDGVKPYESAEQAMEAYQKLTQHKASLVAEVARLEKLSEEVAPWGEFDAQMYSKLQSRGVQLRYFVTQTSTYDSSVAEWSQKNPVVEISRTTSSVYFVIVTVDQSALELDAQEI